MSIQTADGVTYESADPFFQFILNDLFRPVVADTVINPNVLLRQIPRTSEHVEGKNIVFPIHTDRHHGVQSIAPEGKLPDPDQQKYSRYAFGVRHIYGRLKFSGVSMAASKTRIASWLNDLQSEVQGLSTDMARYRQFILHSDGSGRLGHIATGATSATQSIAVHSGIPGNASNYDVTKRFRVGMRVAFVRDPTTAPALVATTALTVVSINKAAGTVTFSASFTSVTGDAIVLASNTDTGLTLNDTSWLHDPMGLAGIINDNNPLDGTAVGFQGVDATAAANDWHRAQMLANGGTLRALSLPLMDLAWTTIMENADVAPSLWLGSFGMQRAYASRVLTDRRFAGSSSPQSFDGGYTALSYNNAPIIPDRDAFTNRFLLPHLADLRFYEMEAPSWMNMDGSVYARMPDHDQYQATMYLRENLGSDVRDKHGALLDVAEV